MADPITAIGAIASVIQLIDFSAKVLARLNEYRSKGDELPKAFMHIYTQLPLLREVLERSRQGINSQSITPDEVKAIEPCLRGCQQQMKKLKDILSAILPEAQDKTVKKLTKGARSMWKESEVCKVDEEIKSYVSMLTFYCAWSSSKLDLRNHNTLAQIQQWLSPPDPHLNLRKSLKLRSADTGKWYLQGAQYEAWKVGGGSFTWLYGSAGSGKTILSSGVIEDLQGYCDVDPARSLAFFFFDFNDAEKQNPISMVKSLLSQFLNRCTHVPEGVRSLHTTCENSRREASEQQLLQALRDTLELLPTPFVVLDALDECGSWNGLFDILQEMQSWGKGTLRILLTSRKEIKIEEALEHTVPPDNRTCLESHLVDKDIGIYVQERLAEDKSFKRWERDSETKEKIKGTLGRKANGMFRWAACQLDALAECVTRGKVRRALQDLPKTLDETYARILRAIDEGPNAEEALKILTWLAYAERPLTTTEISEVTGIVMGEECHFDEDEVLQDPSDILRICSSLVSVATGGRGSDESDDDEIVLDDQSVNSEKDLESGMVYVRLAHFSVKEYLVSNRPCIARYRLGHQESHNTLAICCLVYLLRFGREEWQYFDCESVFPFARYASRFWTQHARASGMLSKQQKDLSTLIFTRNSAAFLAWMRFFDINRPWERYPNVYRTLNELPSSVYVASLEGLMNVVGAILDAGADVNTQGGQYGNALQAASYRGDEKIVHMLIDAGADINAQGGRFGNALQAGSWGGHEKVVQMLLSAKAKVNVQGGRYGNALQAASMEDHETVAQMLLDAGADVNAQGGSYGNALQAASIEGHEKMVQMLVGAGAEMNTLAGYFGNALEAASWGGHERVVQMLLAAGADINAQAGRFGNALQAASSGGHQKVVQMLLDAGAEVNAQGGSYGNALQAASFEGHEKVVQMLLAAGADANAQGGKYGNALYAATERGEEKVVQMLLAAGAEVNAQGGRFGNALQAASWRDHEKVVQMLLAAGAETANNLVA